ncbi:hypothetical protein H6G11_16465 [Cyanobacterium aponinum FACHB-4101]|uniref:hypothetical protein n=1 Tax=Cyanobacterium aponinum TaxID=379064 RepID=UPI0016809D29|nr:hypothetical protein [Cyanobacterium aponinum]MBD2395839.1 hypothetical protein [Cyanobacterium aponinum FACHB-4101]
MIANPTNFLQAFNEFSDVEKNANLVANVKSALFRHYGTGVRKTKTKQARLSDRMIKTISNILAKVTIDSDFDREQHLQIFEQGCDLLNLSPEKRKSPRSYFNRLLTFIENTYIDKKPSLPEKTDLYRIKDKVIDKSYIEDNRKIREYKRKITLESDPEFYTDRLAKKYPDLSKEDLRNIAEIALKKLDAEFNEYKVFWQEQKLRDESIKTNMDRFKRILGWLYREDDTTLTVEDLSIRLLVPVINNKVDRKKLNYNQDAIYIAEGRLKDEAREHSRELIRLIDRFFRKYDIRNKENANKYIDALVSYGKYLYQDITEIEEADNYEDIILIRYLRAKKRKIREMFEDSQTKPLPLTWDEVLEVFYAYKKDADLDTYDVIEFDKRRNKTYLYKKEKRNRSKAQHLEKFLILACFAIIPPDRQRTFRELTYGDTLKYGKLDNVGNLIPLEPTLDSNKEGEYFLDLPPSKHKMGNKTKKHYLQPIPNRKFDDGTHFYDYLDKWLFGGYRKILASPEATKVFVQTQKGGDYKSSAELCNLIKSMFKRKTGVAVNPHKLRNIFATHLANLGVDDAIRRSAAYSMRHSFEVAEKVYCNQNDQEKVKPINDFMDQIWSNKNNKGKIHKQ